VPKITPRNDSNGSNKPWRREPPREPPKSDPRAEFESGLRRSRKDNLWRRLTVGDEEPTLSVFSYRDDGQFGWCICDAAGQPHYSRRPFESEAETLADLHREIEE
jgi:hypothetical protein